MAERHAPADAGQPWRRQVTAMLRQLEARQGSRGAMIEAIGDVDKSTVSRWLTQGQIPSDYLAQRIDDLLDAQGTFSEACTWARSRAQSTSGAADPPYTSYDDVSDLYAAIGDDLTRALDNPEGAGGQVVTLASLHGGQKRLAHSRTITTDGTSAFEAAVLRLLASPPASGWRFRHVLQIGHLERLEQVQGDRLLPMIADSPVARARCYVGPTPPNMNPLVIGDRVAYFGLDSDAGARPDRGIRLTTASGVQFAAAYAEQLWQQAPYELVDANGVRTDTVAEISRQLRA